MTKNRALVLAYGALAVVMIALLLTTTWSPISLTRSDSGPSADAVGTYLFVQTAESGTLQEEGGGGYSLVLEGAAPLQTYFTDRPARDAGTMTVDEAIDLLWDSEADPPNAALQTTLGDGTAVTLAVELTDPVYDADAETLSFSARLLDGVTPGLADFEFDAAEDFPVRLRAPELFIDSSYSSCSVYVTNSTNQSLTRQSYDPSRSTRWGNHTPPDASIAAGVQTSWVFRFKSLIDNEHGKATYAIGSTGSTVELSWSCRYEVVPEATGADCQVTVPNTSPTYGCDARTTKFFTQSAGNDAVFTVEAP